MPISRRDLLRNSAMLSGGLGLLQPSLALAGARDAGHWSRDLPPVDPMLALMNRASFGVSEAMWQAAADLSANEWLEQQLDPAAIDDTEVELLIARDFPGYLLEFPQQNRFYRKYQSNTVTRPMITGGDLPGLMGAVDQIASDPMSPPAEFKLDVNRMARDLQGASFYRQLYSKRQLFEVMVDFWSNHFNVFLWSHGGTKRYKPQEDRLAIRPNALASFLELLRASARSPAMLSYLDGEDNRVGRPNENYARELLELHTFGIEHYHAGSEQTRPEGFYTEQDIQEIARCFTGWRIGSGQMVFEPGWHDTGDKTVLGVTIPGQSGAAGEQEGEAVLALLASHPSTARHVARKLAERFVNDAAPTTLVDALAASFAANGGDVPSLLRTLFGSAEFAASADEKFLRPLDFMHKVLRVLDAVVATDPRADIDWSPVQTANPYVAFEGHYLGKDGQALFSWDTPDGYPTEAEHWAGPNGLLQRWRMVAHLVENRWWKHFVTVDLDALAPAAGTAAELVDALSDRVLRRALLPEDRTVLIDLARANEPADATLSPSAREAAIRGVLTGLVGSAYFQLN